MSCMGEKASWGWHGGGRERLVTPPPNVMCWLCSELKCVFTNCPAPQPTQALPAARPPLLCRQRQVPVRQRHPRHRQDGHGAGGHARHEAQEVRDTGRAELAFATECRAAG